jgi:hypothetical protein
MASNVVQLNHRKNKIKLQPIGGTETNNETHGHEKKKNLGK